jgi:hypothetical protein
MTTRRPTPKHKPNDHPQGDHSAVATLVGAARVATKWTLAGGLIAAASYMAGWIERGHSDDR